VYATREGAGQGEAEAVDWTDLSMNFTYAQLFRTAKNSALSPPFLSLFFLRSAEERRVDFTQRRVK
jgi:hypothetical protein